MIIASYIIIITLGLINCTSVFNERYTAGAQLFNFIFGLGLVAFGITGLVLR